MSALVVWTAAGVLVAAVCTSTPSTDRLSGCRSARPRPRSVVVTAPERLGGWLRARLGRLGWAGDPDLPPSDLMIGVAAAVAVAALPVAPVLAPAVVMCVVLHSIWERRARSRRHDELVARGLPDVIDRLALAVRGGLTLRQAVLAGQVYAPDPFCSAFAAALDRHANGEAWSDALRHAATALGPVARSVLTLLVAAESDGAPIGDALARAGDEARRRRRSMAEQRARRLPVLMLLPLVACSLPAFGLLTVAPLIYATLRELELPI